MPSVLEFFQRILTLYPLTQGVFSSKDLFHLLNTQDNSSSRMFLHHCVRQGVLLNPCRGIYVCPFPAIKDFSLIYRIAAKLRCDDFNYLSLESVLCEAGLISQLLLDRVTIMTSGPSRTFHCKGIGTIEFTHTSVATERSADLLSWDQEIGFFRASPELALRDLKAVRRNLGMIQEAV